MGCHRSTVSRGDALWQNEPLHLGPFLSDGWLHCLNTRRTSEATTVKLTQLVKLYMNQFQPAAYGLCTNTVPSPHAPSVRRDHAQSYPTATSLSERSPALNM